MEIMDNGLKIYHFPYKSNRIGLAIGVKIGSIYEDKKFRGISHFLEHMMFKSNKKYSEKEMTKIIEFLGGEWNAVTERTITIYFGEFLLKNFSKVLDVYKAMFENDKFNEKEFEKEKGVILSEVRKYKTNPEFRIYSLSYLSVFGNSDFGDPIEGYIDSVKNIDKEILEEFKAKYYHPNNMFIVLIGGGEKEINLIKEKFGSLREEKIKLKEPELGKKRNIIEKRDIDNCYLAYSFEFDKKDYIDFLISKFLLYGGTSSILFEKIRNELGLGYSPRAFVDLVREKGIFSIIIDNFDCNRKEEVIEKIEELKDYKIDVDYEKGRKNYYDFINEKEKDELDERALETAWNINNGYEIDDYSFKKEILNKDWKEVKIRKGVISLIGKT